jgi:radical SAM superfamily enzyme YgiQ (UPF0313 family)
MKLRFIYPRFKKFLQEYPDLRAALSQHLVGDYSMPPSLALPILAALTPPDIEVNLTDDNIGQPIDYDEKIDCAVISCFTPQAQRAYAIADEYRRRGTRTIIGGIHPTMRPDEALEHADAVCIGEGEPVWPDVLRDLRHGKLQRKYQSTDVYDLADFPVPRRSIFSSREYTWNAHLVLTMRGCPVRCGGCPVPGKEDTAFRFRPVDAVIDDIRNMPYREFYLIEDTVMLPGKKNMKYLLSIMDRTKDLDVSIFLASTMMMVSDPEFYRKLRRGKATSIYTIFGFDRISRKLFSRDCSPEEWQQGIDLVKMIEDAGIHFFASFGIGFDDQDKSVTDRILRFSEQAGIDLAEFYIITPFPGTPLGEQFVREGRILHRNYEQWNHANVVFRPAHFTEQELLEAFFALWREFYRGKTPTKTLRSFELGSTTASPGPG